MFRVGWVLVVRRISGSGIRKAVLSSVWIMDVKGRYHSCGPFIAPPSFHPSKRDFRVAPGP